jgi:hypothetical protein
VPLRSDAGYGILDTGFWILDPAAMIEAESSPTKGALAKSILWIH